MAAIHPLFKPEHSIRELFIHFMTGIRSKWIFNAYSFIRISRISPLMQMDLSMISSGA